MPAPNTPLVTAQLGLDALLQTLLDTSQTGIAQLSPVYGLSEPAQLIDFTYQRLNPAAQRLLGLPEFPAASYRTLAPHDATSFAFYRDTFLSGEAGYYSLAGHTATGQPCSLHVVAQRTEAQLVVSFTETDQPTAAPEGEVLRQAFAQTPAAIALLHGPEHRFEYVNAAFGKLFPGRELLGHTVAEVLPQDVTSALEQVYQSGSPKTGVEVPLHIAQPGEQPTQQHYFNFIYQAHPEHGQPARLSVFANDVTSQVLARHQRETQWAEWQLFEQASVAVAVLCGPEHIVELANPAMCTLWNRTRKQVLGQPLFDAVPEVKGYEFEEILAKVLATGQPHFAYELASRLSRPEVKEPAYLNFVYQPLREGNGQITGVLVLINEVSEQVRSRLRVQELNEELRTANEELLANNHELARTQQQLRKLNQELECRVDKGVREAQAAYAETERQRLRLARFFQQAPAAICVLDGPDLVYELVNPNYQQFFPNRSLVGQPLREAAPELVDQPMYNWLRAVYETGVTHEGHEVLLPVTLPGSHRPEDHFFNCVYQARHNEQGRVDGVLVFALDVTAQVRAQRRIKALQAEAQLAAERRAQERETFYQVFEQTPAAVALMWGPEHRFEYVNHAYMQLFPDRVLRYRTLAEALPEAVEQGFTTLLDQVYRTGETFIGTEVPLTIIPLDGQEPHTEYFNFSYQAYRENNRTLGVSVFGYNVTVQVLARRQHENALAQLYTRLRTVFEQAPVALALLQGPTYVVTVANPTICELWGRDTDQVLNRPLFELLPEVTTQGFRELLDEVRRTGQPYVAHEKPAQLLRHGKPETMYFNFVYQPLADAHGNYSSVVIVATDMTLGVLARQQVDQGISELQTANEQLRRTNVDLDNFIYTASHDLKSPIANIEGLLLLLRKQLPTEARQAGMVPRVLDMMQGAIERFQLTIAQLTDLAKLQHAHTQPAEEVNLPALVEAVRLDLEPLLEEANALLRVNLDSCGTVSFAPQHLRSIIYNLLSNAIKYRHPARPLEVAIRCYSASPNTIIEVEDNGLGLTNEQQSKLFGMFRRLHAHVPGSGVGLYMVKRMLENAGGSITVHSQPDIGTTFTVSFPNQGLA